MTTTVHASGTTVLAATGATGADWFTRAVEGLVASGMDWGARILGVVVVLIVASVLARWVRRSVFRMFGRAKADATLAAFVANFARWSVFVLGIVACLSIFGINIAAVTAVIGAAGLAVGLAMQGSLSNMAAGLMLLLLRPFSVGDSISVAGNAGKVNDIDLFNTKLDTADNRRLIVPNSVVFGATIENSTHHAKRRVDLTVRTAFGADIETTRAALELAAAGVPQRIADAKREAQLVELGPTGMIWHVRVWVATPDVGAARDELVKAVKQRLDAAGVTVPNAP
ncbi:MAG: mechanosensitive ion channel family protein [Phycisphaerales bacterium]